MHNSMCTAALVELGLFLVEKMCTGNLWLVDNTYVGSKIGIRHHWHSSIITDHPFGTLPWKLAVNKIKDSCNSRILYGKLMTIR